MKNKYLEKYKDLLCRYVEFNSNKVPLCAAETYVSDFVKQPLASIFEGKYCMNNLNYDKNNDFIGSQYINELFRLLTDLCNEIFNAKYTDARTLSGMNCMSITISTLLSRGDKVLLASPEQGGHASVPLLLSLYGVEWESIPYNYNNYDFDYDKLNLMLNTKKYKGIIIPQSDLINCLSIQKISLSDEMVIFDATQTLGFIACGIHPNPLIHYHNLVLIGGTHKTLPGPTCGIIMTNNDDYIKILDNKISPSYLRNVQPNNIASLILALIEQQQIGREYQTRIIENCNILGSLLEEFNFSVGKLPSGKYTNTHQLFLLTSKTDMEIIYENAIKYGITLNKKEKPLFDGYGIRIGLQEITRYGWKIDELRLLSHLIFLISKKECDDLKVKKIIETLVLKKTNKYTFNDLITQ